MVSIRGDADDMKKKAASMAFGKMASMRQEAAPLAPAGSPRKFRQMGAAPVKRAPAQPGKQLAGGGPTGSVVQPGAGMTAAPAQQGQAKMSMQTSGLSAGGGMGLNGARGPGLPPSTGGIKTPDEHRAGAGARQDAITQKPVQEQGTGGSGGAPSSMDALTEQAIREMFGFKPDAEAQKALIQQQTLGMMGESLNDARAGMGRAGFGASGALGALEGDIMRQAGLDASGAMLAAERQAQQDRLGALEGGLGASARERDLAIQEKAFELALQMLADDQGTTVPSGDGNSGGGAREGAQSVFDSFLRNDEGGFTFGRNGVERPITSSNSGTPVGVDSSTSQGTGVVDDDRERVRRARRRAAERRR